MPGGSEDEARMMYLYGIYGSEEDENEKKRVG